MSGDAIIKDISALHAAFQPIANLLLHICCDDLKMRLKVTETRRSEERQRALKLAGASQVEYGWHQAGLALDVAIFDEAGRYLTSDAGGEYTKYGYVAQALGGVWGGNWKMRDYGHVEWHDGFTLAQLRAALQEGIVK